MLSVASNETNITVSFSDDANAVFSASVSSTPATDAEFTDDDTVQSDTGFGGTNAEADTEIANLVYGIAATVEVGTVTTGNYPAVTNSGTKHAAVLDFVLPAGGGGPLWNIGEGLKLDTSTGTLSVDTATAVEPSNTKPITSAAVYTEVGNINALLATI